jgi:RimJ/RimL family protein N-acetyltransferase
VEVRHPLQTGVAKHNIASVRVLEKCHFVVIGEGDDEYVVKLAAD